MQNHNIKSKQQAHRMSNVDEILSYKKNPDEDFYALLHCDESSSVSKSLR